MPITGKPTAATGLALSVDVILVPVEQLDYYWPDAKRFIAAGAKASRDKWNLYDCYSRLSAGTAYLWMVYDRQNRLLAVCVTEVLRWDQRQSYKIVFVAGRHIRRWIDAISFPEAHARALKCDSMYFNAEPRIALLLNARRNYRITHYCVEKDIAKS